jgi:hypothetical protein
MSEKVHESNTTTLSTNDTCIPSSDVVICPLSTMAKPMQAGKKSSRADRKAEKPPGQAPVVAVPAPEKAVQIEQARREKEETGDMPHYRIHSYPQNSDIAPSLVIRTISEASHLVFHPTVFLICATNSTSGAAVHVSQLAPHGSATSIAGMPFDLPLQGVWADWV